MAVPFVIQTAVEGDLDAIVAEVLIRHIGAELGTVFGLQGKPFLRKRIQAWNAAAYRQAWLVLFDLDDVDACPAQELEAWLPRRSPGLCLRIAVPTIEAWLLADHQGMANFLGVASSLLPPYPEQLPDPKAFVVNLARKSKKKSIREGLVPRPQGSRKVGKTYTSDMIRFALDTWSIDRAAPRAESLRRAHRCLEQLRAFPTDSP